MVTPKIPALSGVRFMAAALVVADHGMLIVPFAHVPWQSNVGPHVGFFAMSLFFVLSGFVIYLNYAPEFRSRPLAEATFNFAVARFARLYPLYAFFMVFTLASIVWARVPPMLPDLYWWIPAMQSWFLGDGKRPLILTVEEAGLTWSISTEVFFYALFPLICVLALRPLRWRLYPTVELPLLTVAALIALVGLYRAFPSVLESVPQMPKIAVMLWYAYHSPYCHIFAFLAGCMTARLYLHLHDRLVGRREAIAAHCIAALCIAFVPFSVWQSWGDFDEFLNFIHANFWNVPAAVGLVFYVARYDSSLNRLLSSPLAVVGGEASYSIYLMHLWLVQRLAGPERDVTVASLLEWLARFSIYVVMTMAVAYGTYRLIEIPARRLIRQTFSLRAQTTTRAATAIARGNA